MSRPSYFDVHTHIQFPAFSEDREAVLLRLKESNTWIVNVGTQYNTSKEAVTLAESVSEGLYATVGLHPTHTGPSFHDTQELVSGEFTLRGETLNISQYEELARHEKVVAIGECGLDYFRLPPESKETQKRAFIEQIHLANTLGKPLMLHIREAYQDAYEILKSEAKVPANVHFFAGDWETAKKFLDIGCTLSFTGVVTFAKNYDEVIQKIPHDRLLTETDAPYVAPVPYRGRRNEPVYVAEVVKKVAILWNMEEGEAARLLVGNALRFFGLPETP
jgi:TatD DNase family protein